MACLSSSRGGAAAVHRGPSIIHTHRCPSSRPLSSKLQLITNSHHRTHTTASDAPSKTTLRWPLICQPAHASLASYWGKDISPPTGASPLSRVPRTPHMPPSHARMWHAVLRGLQGWAHHPTDAWACTPMAASVGNHWRMCRAGLGSTSRRPSLEGGTMPY